MIAADDAKSARQIKWSYIENVKEFKQYAYLFIGHTSKYIAF